MKQTKRHTKILHLLLGFLIASTAYLYLEYRYEQKILNAFISSIQQQKSINKYNEESLALAAMDKTYLQMRHVELNAMEMKLNLFDEMFNSPLLNYALTKDGACGGNSLVLSQILNGMGISARPVQMKVNGKFGGHIIVEAQINHKWVVLDPLYNLSFRNASGELASFEEVKNNLPYYQLQFPAEYNPAYKFEDAQYTNWSKVPLLGNATKWVVGLFIGKTAANSISIRSYLLNPKKILFYISFYLLGFSFISILNKRYFKIHLPVIKTKKRLAKNIAPVS